jgi:hypothetical protein
MAEFGLYDHVDRSASDNASEAVDHLMKDWSTSGVVTSTGLVGLSAVRVTVPTARLDDIAIGGNLKDEGGAKGVGRAGGTFCSIAAGVSFILSVVRVVIATSVLVVSSIVAS